MQKAPSSFALLFGNPRTDRVGSIAVVAFGLAVLVAADVRSDPSSIFSLTLLTAASVVAATGFRYLWVNWRREVRAHAMLTTLMRARGRVTSIRKDWLSDAYCLQFSYVDAMGQSRQGVKLLRQVDAFAWREGAEGEVRYAASDPRLYLWVSANPLNPPPIAELPFDPASVRKPGTLNLIRRSRALKNAALIAVYFVIVTVFLLLVALEEDADDRLNAVLLFGTILAGLAIWFLYSIRRGLREVREWRRIVRDGVVAAATVTQVEEQRQRLGRWTWKPGWVIAYQFHLGKKSYAGTSGLMPARRGRQWRTRERCVVIYDSRNPNRSVWVGKPDN